LGDQVVMLYDFLGTAVDSVNGDGDGCCDDQLDSVNGDGAVAAVGPATDQDGVAPLPPLAPCSGLDGGTGRLGDQLVMEYDFLAAVAVTVPLLDAATSTGGQVLVYDDDGGGAGAGGGTADADVDHVVGSSCEGGAAAAVVVTNVSR
jgi:hypothetical protein